MRTDESDKKNSGLRKLSLICFVFALTLFAFGMAFKMSNAFPLWPAYFWASLLCAIGAIAAGIIGMKSKSNSIEDQLARLQQRIKEQKTVVRDGISYHFIELDTGRFYVRATRQIRPHLTALFPVDEKDIAEKWRDYGVVPEGEIAECISGLQNGTWPDPGSPADPNDPYSRPR